MPIVGDEIRGNEIGYTTKGSARIWFVWVQCPGCLEERWARKKSALNPVNNTKRLCSPCAVKQAKTFRLNTAKAAVEGRI